MTRDELEYQDKMSRLLDTPLGYGIKSDSQLYSDIQKSRTFDELSPVSRQKLQSYLARL